MTTALARTALTCFVTDQSATAIALTGPWGSGKTWLWTDVIREQAARPEPTFSRYSYVSLFGLNALAELKAALFENAVLPGNVQQGATPQSLKEEMQDIFKEDTAVGAIWNFGEKGYWRGRKNAQAVASFVPFWGNAVRSATFLAIRNYVICIDDVERKGKDLAMTDVLGLVSYLREQRNCRVLLVLNEAGLGNAGEPERDRFSGFREKVLEREIVFDPTAEECAGHVLNAELEMHRIAARYAVELGITNMRILQRLARLMDEFASLFSDAREPVVQAFVHAATVLTWSFYGEAGDAPPYRLTSSVKYGDFFVIREPDPKTPDERAWLSMLSAYGFRSLDDVDVEICHALERGYVDFEATRRAVTGANERADAEAVSGSIREAWALFHDSFADNAADFTALLTARASEGARWMRFTEAETTAHVLRRLGTDAQADGFTRAWIEENHRIDPTRLVLADDHFGTGRADEGFRNAVAAVAKEAERAPELGKTIQLLLGRNGWSQTDIDVLAAATDKDFLAFFRGAATGPNLTGYVRTVLQFGTVGDTTGVYHRIAVAASLALRTLAAESAVNAMRVGNFVLFDNPPAAAPPPNPFVPAPDHE